MGTELTKAGYEVVRVPLEPSGGGVSVRRRLRDLRPPTVTDPAKRSVLLVDGIGLADWWTRRRFLRIARRQGWGILLTAHRDLGLPVLCRTALTADDARRIIPLIVGLDNQAPAPRSLSKENPATGPASAKASNGLPHLTDAFEAHGAAPSASAAEELVPQELVAQLLDRHDGNLREVLFSLYDWYDDRQREQEEKRGHRHSRF